MKNLSYIIITLGLAACSQGTVHSALDTVCDVSDNCECTAASCKNTGNHPLPNGKR